MGECERDIERVWTVSLTERGSVSKRERKRKEGGGGREREREVKVFTLQI